MKRYKEPLRKEYAAKTLKTHLMDRDPIRQFLKWFNHALKCDLGEPNAMAIASATKAGVPSLRFVLLKGVDSQGFYFFTNYQSKKGRELQRNPSAAAVIYWPELSRQVRIEGKVKIVSGHESDKYFESRPRGAQISTWASQQSRVVESRKRLIESVAKYEAKFLDQKVPRPAYWGGYVLAPEKIEFWQGQKNRLHDRILYKKINKRWRKERLAP